MSEMKASLNDIYNLEIAIQVGDYTTQIKQKRNNK